MEDLNRLHVYEQSDADRDSRTAGVRDILVTEPSQPYLHHWWAPGHILGWEHTLVHQWIAVLEQVAGPGDGRGDGRAAPASFADGLQACRVVDAIQRSTMSASWSEVKPPTATGPE